MDNIKLKEIKTEIELQNVLELCYAILGNSNPELYGYEAWKKRLEEGISPMVYAEMDNIVVSAVLGRAENQDSMVIGLVACHENYRRRGITKRLMQYFEALAKEKNYKYITLGSKEDAFYEQCGYKVIFQIHGQNIYQKILGIKTTVYFVRHAEPNYNNHDDMSRELTAKGLEDRKLVTKFLHDKSVDIVLSSPFKRAVDTVREFAEEKGLEIGIVEDFRERRIDSVWIEDFNGFCKAQWADFNYKLSDGECLAEVQERNIAALQKVLKEYAGNTIVVGSHGTALSTIVNYYDKSFGHAEFEKIRGLMPWVVEFQFEEQECVDMKQYNLFIGDK